MFADEADVLDDAAVRIGAAAAAGAAGGAVPENPNLTDNWDDAEGYYRVQTGEVGIPCCQYRIIWKYFCVKLIPLTRALHTPN